MLRNSSIRTKLALVVVPPLAVILGLVWIIVTPKLDLSKESQQSAREAALAQRSELLLDQLQTERGLSAVFVASQGQQRRAELTAQRKVSDVRRNEFLGYMATLSAEDRRAEGGDDAIRAAETLDGLRTQVDGLAITPIAAYNDFTVRIGHFLGLNRQLANEGSDAELLRQGQAIFNFTAAKELMAQQRDRGALVLTTGAVTTQDFADLASLRDGELRYLDAYRATAGDAAARYDEIVTGTAVAEADQDSEVMLNFARGSQVPPITVDQWWTAWSNKLDAVVEAEQDIFAGYVDRAESTASDARMTVIKYVMFAVLSVAVALVLAGLLSRSIVRRLRSMSYDARIIATERLPEVLKALRRPTREALAEALPQVPTNSSDELDVVAEAFNTVLRVSVETSMEHVQQRAATVTNMLVNLGRRNQALIDRQLELIDRLEAREQDPDALEELFKLDHMVTRMRRNAENLLVLASDQAVRAWSEPVPMMDVLRSAMSEVHAMERVQIELTAADNRQVAGRHAVAFSHLVAELVENAALFSPPTAPIIVRADSSANNGFRVWVEDRGVGMPPPEMAEANERLTNPPEIEELATDRIGFQVVGRLARRLAVTVELLANPSGGIAARIVVPESLFEPAPPVPIRGAMAAGATGHPDRPAVAAPHAAAAPVPAPALPALPAPVTYEDVMKTAAAAARPTAPAATPAPVPIMAAAPVPAATPAPAPIVAAAPAPVPVPSPAVAPTPAARPAAMPARGSVLATATATARAAAAAAVPAVAITEDGLVMRQPGASIANNEQAHAAEAGKFRRLPTPGDPGRPGAPPPPAADEGEGGVDDAAARRQRMLSELSGGIGRGRTAPAQRSRLPIPTESPTAADPAADRAIDTATRTDQENPA